MDAEAIWLLTAVFAQVALTLGLLVYLGFIRIPLITEGKVKIAAIALDRDAWPDRERQVSNAVDNQFQLPVLFFVGAVVALNIGPIWVETVLAMLFVASRFVHAAVHVTSNNVVQRFWVYVAGFAALTAFWVVLGGRFVVVALLFGRS